MKNEDILKILNRAAVFEEAYKKAIFTIKNEKELKEKLEKYYKKRIRNIFFKDDEFFILFTDSTYEIENVHYNDCPDELKL